MNTRASTFSFFNRHERGEGNKRGEGDNEGKERWSAPPKFSGQYFTRTFEQVFDR